MSSKYSNYIEAGAIVLDVRSTAEYGQEHFPGSLNIPIDKLNMNLHKLDKNSKLILCCASGGRSAMAKSILENEGFKDLLDVGAWQKLR